MLMIILIVVMLIVVTTVVRHQAQWSIERQASVCRHCYAYIENGSVISDYKFSAAAV